MWQVAHNSSASKAGALIAKGLFGIEEKDRKGRETVKLEPVLRAKEVGVGFYTCLPLNKPPDLNKITKLPVPLDLSDDMTKW